MASTPSLYRRHRPRTFADVVGQAPIVRTLSNAVEQGKVHHAYLFVGSRGTGKTSMAKILAACLNCERGPTIEPCGQCESCVSIARASSLDVIEMDAASHNSVDDIRELRENVNFAPVSGRHKVYILDEAHMLSTQAWNAFLKTLEEPPPNTIFVLATTEAQKVLPTVVDRCHRFDFQRPSVEQVAAVLGRVADAESIALPEEARALIARHAAGSFRDALGTLEQLVTYGGPKVELDAVLAVLGVADFELLFAAFDAVGDDDARAALLAVDRLAQAGRDPGQFVRDLEAHGRELLVVQALGEVPAELSLTSERDERLLAQAQRLGRERIVRVLDLLAAALEALKAGADARVQLELALVKAASPEVDPAAEALLTRIARLEGQVGSAGTSAAPPSPAPRQVKPPPPAPSTEPEAAAGGPVAAVAIAEPEPDSAPDAPPLDLERMRSLWPAVIETVRARNVMLGALLDGANPVALASDEVTLAFAESAEFLKRKAEDSTNREAVAAAIQAVSGRVLRLVYELRSDADGGAPVAPVALSEEEWVERIKTEFGAQEIPVEQEAGGP